jgi:hypothetical protein
MELMGAGIQMIQGVVVLLVVLAGSFAVGYLTRECVSHKRRAEARIWRAYSAPEGPLAANTNERPSAVKVDLGPMLYRRESRARERRSHTERKRG